MIHGDISSMQPTYLMDFTLISTTFGTLVMRCSYLPLGSSLLEPANVIVKTWSTVPPNSYDAPNPGTIMVGFEVTVPANTSTAISVELLPEKAVGKHKKIQALQSWNK